MAETLEVRGIILENLPQGEYGRRLRMLTDRLGKITVFASGAARQNSRLIGALRPMSCGSFSLSRGRNAYNIREAKLMDSFEEIAMDPDAYYYAAYLMELVSWFSDEGMDEPEAKKLLNLLYVGFAALRERALPLSLIRRIFELRTLVIQGEYTEDAPYGDTEACRTLWQRSVSAPLSALFRVEDIAPLKDGYEDFEASAAGLMRRQVEHSFRSLQILQAL